VDGLEVTCSYQLHADNPCLDGHFPGRPILPAVAQLGLLDSVLRQLPQWPAGITGGAALKFLQQIVPGSTIVVHLVRTSETTVRFTLSCDKQVAARGVVTVQ
jgi:3-hydroxymyristoyl/3-hydroxydecanoyl-(acyl carrier protein) dehydratase